MMGAIRTYRRFGVALLGAVAALLLPAAAQADPPTVAQPVDVTVEARSAAGAIVHYQPPAASDDNGARSVECDPPPGSLFPVGVSTVDCSAFDQTTGEGTVVSFLVRVTPRAQERASAGGVVAKLFYAKSHGEVPATFTNFRIQISRGGVLLLDAAAAANDYAPAGYGDKPSVFVRDLDGDGEPEVLLDLYSGGAHCCFSSRIYRYDASATRYRVSTRSWGNPAYRLRDLNGDRKPEFVTADDRFAYRFASFASAGLPIKIWSYRAGTFTNVTRKFAKLVANDAAQQWRSYLNSRGYETRGFIAAWAADEYSLGHGRKVDRTLTALIPRGDLAGYPPRDPRSFVRILKRYLRSTGYSHG